MINPKYNVDRSAADVRLGYAIDNTSVQVDAQAKKVTVAHSFSNNDRLAPTVSANGDFSVSYTRDLPGGKLTTTYAPKDSLQFRWNDGAWDTTVKAPLDGFYKANKGITVNMRRSVDVF